MLKHTIMLAAVAGLVLALAPAAQAGLVGELGILTEAWITANPINPGTGAFWAPGDAYHLVFATSGARDGKSSTIGDYNTFVNEQAENEGSLVKDKGVTWKALASTSSADANTNAPVGATAPVYNLTLDLIATGYGSLWSGALLAPIDVSEDGIHGPGTVAIWTGTGVDGKAYEDNKLRHLGADRPMVGKGTTDATWICWDNRGKADQRSMYAMSAALAIVPEPATQFLLAAGGMGLLIRRRRRRRA